MNFKSKKWTIVLLVLLIVLSIGIFIKFAIGTEIFNTFDQNPFKKQSRVKVSLVDSKLNLDFDLNEEEGLRFTSFINNWFDIPDQIKSLSFGMDPNINALVSQSLPVELNLNVTDKSLQFNSNRVAGLQNPVIKSDIDFATGSSTLNVEYYDSSKYQIRVEDPAGLIDYATASGILIASTKIEGLFKSLPKVATIEMNVNGKNVYGSIKLK